MKKESIVHSILIDNTIHLIAEGGFEAATTHAITYSNVSAPDVKLNEVYIYRLFGGKEQLYAEAFEKLDSELVGEISRDLVEFQNTEYSRDMKLKIMFMHLWHFLLQNEEHCRAYVRFYYSVYFKGMTQKKHNKNFNKVVEKFSVAFKPEADVLSLLHSVLTTMLDFAIRVYNGELSDSEDSADHIFNMLYSSLSSYFIAENQTKTL